MGLWEVFLVVAGVEALSFRRNLQRNTCLRRNSAFDQNQGIKVCYMWYFHSSISIVIAIEMRARYLDSLNPKSVNPTRLNLLRPS